MRKISKSKLALGTVGALGLLGTGFYIHLLREDNKRLLSIVDENKKFRENLSKKISILNTDLDTMIAANKSFGKRKRKSRQCKNRHRSCRRSRRRSRRL